jgi:DDE family transposase
MLHDRGRTHLGDQDHDVVDGGKARIILTALAAPAEGQEQQPALDLLWWTRFRGKLRPRQITADPKDGTIENIVSIEDHRIRAYGPLLEAGRHPGLFDEQDFVDDAATDTDRCQGGQTLRFLSHCQTKKQRIDAAPALAGRTCALKPQGTTSSRGRRVGRSRHAPDRDRGRGDHATEADAKAIRKRQVGVEPRFAEAKTWHGVRRFRLRGLERVNGEALLIAAGPNLKRLLSWRGWGRRPFPSGAAGIARPTRPARPAQG